MAASQEARGAACLSLVCLEAQGQARVGGTRATGAGAHPRLRIGLWDVAGQSGHGGKDN